MNPNRSRPRARPPVALLDYGVGNLHSAAKALDRAGAEVRMVPTVAAAEAAGAWAMVVPGVGAYRACLEGLGRAGGAAAVAAWIDVGRPLLGICVGMQLLFEASEEGPVGDGIGALAGTVRRLGGFGGHGPAAGSTEAVSQRGRGAPRWVGGPVKVPHIGWDEVTVQPGGSGGTVPRPEGVRADSTAAAGPPDGSRSRLFAGIADGARFYFVHSYAPEASGAAVAAVCDYGSPFAAAVERGNLFGTQFHPEKSSAAGHALLSNFVALVAEWGAGDQEPEGARGAVRGIS